MTATVRGWAACTVPIALWMVHLTAVAALAETTCDRSGLAWLPHAVTAALLVGCVPFLVMAGQLARDGGRDGAAGGDRLDETESGADLHLLGWLGLGLGAASVLLIVAEELIVVGVDPCL